MNVNCHEVTLMVNVLIATITWHMPQNRVSDTISHVTPNIEVVLCKHQYEWIWQACTQEWRPRQHVLIRWDWIMCSISRDHSSFNKQLNWESFYDPFNAQDKSSLWPLINFAPHLWFWHLKRYSSWFTTANWMRQFAISSDGQKVYVELEVSVTGPHT